MLSGPDKCRCTLSCFSAPNSNKKLRKFKVKICQWIYLEFLCPNGPRFALEGECCNLLWQISFQNRFHIHVYFWRLWTLNSFPRILVSFGERHLFILSRNKSYHFLRRIAIDKFAGCVLFCLKKFCSLGQTSKWHPFLAPSIKRNTETSAKGRNWTPVQQC